MDRGGTQAAMKAVVTQCGIKKKFPSIRYVTAECVNDFETPSCFI
jgi:hypothetical protein